MTPIAVTTASPKDLPALVVFFRAMAAAEAPDDPAAADRGEAGLRRSVAGINVLARDEYPLFLARVGGEPAGYLQCAILPKADARVGYLFVDEIYVLPAYRRQGVARALLEAVQSLAEEWGLAGVRLLVREENQAARELYRRCGFVERKTVLCQWARGEGQRTEEGDR